MSLPSIGPKVAHSIQNYFSNVANKDLVNQLIFAGVRFDIPEDDIEIDSKFYGLKFVITGSFDDYKRTDLASKIKDLGGTVSSNVSYTTNYLIAGDNPGSKHKRAKELGVKILDEKGLLQLLNG